jgi:hypothetical protein
MMFKHTHHGWRPTTGVTLRNTLAGLAALMGMAAVAGCNSTPGPNNPADTTTSPLQSQSAGPASSSSPAPSTAPGVASGAVADPGCAIGGCSGELCSAAGATGAPGFSTCQYQREWECYKTAHCARAADGTCGWKSSPELDKCLKVH